MLGAPTLPCLTEPLVSAGEIERVCSCEQGDPEGHFGGKIEAWFAGGQSQRAMWLRRAKVRLFPELDKAGRSKKQDRAVEAAEAGRRYHGPQVSPRAQASGGRLHLRRSVSDPASKADAQGAGPLAFLPPATSLAGSWRLALAVLLALVALGTVLALAFFRPFWSAAVPMAVGAAPPEKFTLLVLSYGPRVPLLRGAISHYSRCPSAGEVVVVWNSGRVPNPADFASEIPVRIRAEARNSLNNRFNVDPFIHTRAVLSMDDDIRVPCADVEAAFATWREDPEALVGFFPRLLEGAPLRFQGERYAVQRGRYNTVLTGAAFIDTLTAFPAYWAPEVAPARAVVDSVFNGEDVLMNFVLANRSAHAAREAGAAAPRPPVKFFRPTRRLDISKFSSVGISHDMARFHTQAQEYLRVFVDTFGASTLSTQAFEWIEGKGRGPPSFCWLKLLGCTYL